MPPTFFRGGEQTGHAKFSTKHGGLILVLEESRAEHFVEADEVESAEHAGIRYGELLQRIIRLGMSWSPETRG